MTTNVRLYVYEMSTGALMFYTAQKPHSLGKLLGVTHIEVLRVSKVENA